jgi:hypothetical protein
VAKADWARCNRARDTKLYRDVAIKVPSFAGDPERASRFAREARLLATLNHPNIAAIYGVEESAGARVLVLELVAISPWCGTSDEPGRLCADRGRRWGPHQSNRTDRAVIEANRRGETRHARADVGRPSTGADR